MNFVSSEFAVLFVLVITLLVLVKNALFRKLVLLAASCIFYAWWDWRFLALLATVTTLDFYVSVFLVKTHSPQKRKLLLWTSILVNLSFLGVFKYYNFFINSVDVLTELFGWQIGTLNIILPIGISFYTFETISYVIDVYHGIAQPANSLLDYAIFISFFPRLVAGPIMRAREFLPQLERGVQIDLEQFIEGLQLFLRGLLKKLVIADNLAIMVDQVYTSPSALSSGTVWLGIFAYSIQILCDFSGYTDMARGIAKTMGFELPPNFNLPYTAQSITEFWQRWHISLSSWLRDYLYIPLGGNRKGAARTYINLIITMLLGGLWHGASWNFVIWGGIHGGYLALERSIFGKKLSENHWTSLAAWVRALLVFGLVSVTWVPFRSPNLDVTVVIFKKLFFVSPQYNFEWYYAWAVIAVPVIVLGGFLSRRFEWKWPIFSIGESYTPAVILLEFLVVLLFSPTTSSPFIYFQF